MKPSYFMDATNLLYLNDCYLRECDAVVTNASSEYVELDQTVFYPTGGGQDHDTGFLVRGDGERVRVKDVQKKGPILHYLELAAGQKPFTAGERVHCVVDWERRHKHMRMHTAQHLVSFVAMKLWGLSTAGNQLHENESRIDFTPVKFTPETLKQLEDESNKLLAEGARVKVYEMDKDEMLRKTDPRRTDLLKLPASVTRVRVIEIEGHDLCPCGGTHVSSLGEVGRIRITGKENKGRERERITYELA
ncbi:MAG TPA: alanyl-tRNA editing protein [archaeon]|nr:alanyl-tRNA editing protein [archaeon]